MNQSSPTTCTMSSRPLNDLQVTIAGTEQAPPLTSSKSHYPKRSSSSNSSIQPNKLSCQNCGSLTSPRTIFASKVCFWPIFLQFFVIGRRPLNMEIKCHQQTYCQNYENLLIRWHSHGYGLFSYPAWARASSLRIGVIRHTYPGSANHSEGQFHSGKNTGVKTTCKVKVATVAIHKWQSTDFSLVERSGTCSRRTSRRSTWREKPQPPARVRRVSYRVGRMESRVVYVQNDRKCRVMRSIVSNPSYPHVPRWVCSLQLHPSHVITRSTNKGSVKRSLDETSRTSKWHIKSQRSHIF